MTVGLLLFGVMIDGGMTAGSVPLGKSLAGIAVAGVKAPSLAGPTLIPLNLPGPEPPLPMTNPVPISAILSPEEVLEGGLLLLSFLLIPSVEAGLDSGIIISSGSE